MSEKWTDRLPSLLENHTEAEPEGLWDAVQAGLVPSKTRTKVAWWPFAATALAAAAAVVLAVFLWKPAPDTKEVSPVPEDRLAVVEEAPRAPEEAVSCTSPEISAPRAQKRADSCSNPAKSASRAPEEADPCANPEISASRAPEEAEPCAGQKPVEPVEAVEPVKPKEAAEPEPVVWPEEEAAPRRKAGKLQLTLTSGGALLAQSAGSATQGYGVDYNPGMNGTKPAQVGITTQMLSRNRRSTTEADHRQLLRVSLGVSYGFTPRWSVGSGLSYSVLRSDYTTLSGSTETQTTRYLHYLGVPLNLQFNLVNTPHFQLYLNAGPMFESAVGARVETNAYVSGQPASVEQENLAVKDFRWSLRAGAGAQVVLLRHFALFAQPGVNWHIPNNAEVESWYTQRPFAVEVDFGFRYLF